MNPTFKQVTKTRYVQLVSELAQEIFVQHYTKLTPKVAAALADKEIEERAALPEVAREYFVALRQSEYLLRLVDSIARGERAHIRTDILRAVILALEHGIYVAPFAGRDFYI